MKKLLITEKAYLAQRDEEYLMFRDIVDDAARTQFELIHVDHIADIAATLANANAALVGEVAALASRGDYDDAYAAVSMALTVLKAEDTPLFERTPFWRDLYRLTCEVEGGEMIDPKTNLRAPFNGMIGKAQDDHRFYEARDRMDETQRRRRWYELTHRKLSRKKAKV